MENVLLVDDDAHIHDAVSMLLNPDSHSLKVCTTTRDAIRIMESGEKIDIVLLDIAISEDDSGFDFLQATRRKKYGVPIIVITSVSDVDTVIEIFRAGADDVVRKRYLPTLRSRMQEKTGRRQRR